MEWAIIGGTVLLLLVAAGVAFYLIGKRSAEVSFEEGGREEAEEIAKRRAKPILSPYAAGERARRLLERRRKRRLRDD